MERELEKALKRIKELEDIEENASECESEIGLEVLGLLLRGGLLHLEQRYNEKGYAEGPKRYERTIKGRDYFRAKWMRRVEVLVPSVIGAVVGGLFTLLGTILTWHLTLG